MYLSLLLQRDGGERDEAVGVEPPVGDRVALARPGGEGA